MRHSLWLLLLGLLFAAPRAGAQPPCPVPEDLALSDLALPAVKRAAAAGALSVLVLGGAAMAGGAAGDPSATLPARLQADLADALPGVQVRVVNGAVPRATAASVLTHLPHLLVESGARLVIWAAGTREIATSADVDPFVAALEQGVRTVREAGADILLVDMQYAPSIARITGGTPFHAALAGTAAVHDVPLLRRYELMIYWNDSGILDLDAREPEARRQVARQLFACLAAALAGPIAAAAR